MAPEFFSSLLVVDRFPLEVAVDAVPDRAGNIIHVEVQRDVSIALRQRHLNRVVTRLRKVLRGETELVLVP